MNTLYGLLMQGKDVPESFSWFGKTAAAPLSTERCSALIAIVLKGVPDTRRVMYVAMLCNLVLNTQYGAEIQKLDPNNTYVKVTRPKTATHSDPVYCVHDLIQPIHAYKDIRLYLQDDITERLDTNSWFDMMGAACLQILREVS